MRISKAIFFLFVILSIGSCSLQKICEERFPCEGKDSTYVKDSLIFVTDTLYVPYQDISFDTISPCPPEINYHKELKQGALSAIVDISNGEIHFYIKSDPEKQIINTPVHEKTIYKTKTVVVNKITATPIPWYYHASVWILLILLVILILYILWSSFKSKLRP